MSSKPSRREKIVMKTIPKAATEGRSTLVQESADVLPAFKGRGDVDLICGNCRTILVEGTYEGQIENVIIQCPKCHAYNEVRFPQLEILNALYEGERVVSGSSTARSISLHSDLPIIDVMKELHNLKAKGLVSSMRDYYYLTPKGLRKLREFARR